MRPKSISVITVVCLATIMSAIAQSSAFSADQSGAQKTTTQKDDAAIDRGQRVFQQNCSRCHNAPQGFPPQISATIVRHMRVRASLSAADEKVLLKLMNP